MVRCEGRWRVRSAPTLGSKVIGTVSNGTILVAQDPGDEPHEKVLPGADAPTGDYMTSLWVKCFRFEAQEAGGVSELKRDAAAGGNLYCLRRNALGYGLYDVDFEPMEGTLVNLTEGLSTELRLDAQKAAADKSEDVSLTWKLLGAADSVGRFFGFGQDDEGFAGVTDELRPAARRRPEEVFEVRQRETLKKAAGALNKATKRIIEKAGSADGDVMAALTPKDLVRRFARIRRDLAATASAAPVVVTIAPVQASAPPPSAFLPGAAGTADGGVAAPEVEAPEGSVLELLRFAELCGRLERSGGWPELTSELRTEVVNFSVKHASQLEDYARYLGKIAAEGGRVAGSPPGSSPCGFASALSGSPLCASPAASEPLSSPGRAAPKLLDFDAPNVSPAAVPKLPGPPAPGFGAGFVLLPPPPAASSSVGAGRLI